MIFDIAGIQCKLMMYAAVLLAIFFISYADYFLYIFMNWQFDQSTLSMPSCSDHDDNGNLGTVPINNRKRHPHGNQAPAIVPVPNWHIKEFCGSQSGKSDH